MRASQRRKRPPDPFEPVRTVGLTLPGVETGTRYDGSPLLKVGGKFMAGLITHPSAEPGSLVVRFNVEDRDALLEEAPDTYYVTEYHRPHPVVLVRLSTIDRETLRDLLSVARRVTLSRGPVRRGRL